LKAGLFRNPECGFSYIDLLTEKEDVGRAQTRPEKSDGYVLSELWNGNLV
jgi:hypothetical protein